MSELDTSDRAITAYADAGQAWLRAWRQEAELSDQSGQEKMLAVSRLIGNDNPLTGKPHSASSAEAVVVTDAGYAAYLQQRRSATLERMAAETAMRAAYLRALYAIVPSQMEVIA